MFRHHAIRTTVLVGGVALAVAGLGTYRYSHSWRTEQSASQRGSSSSTSKAAQPPSLSPAARKLIWDVEQRAFQISHKAAPRLTAALTQADRAAVLEFFATDFQGRLLEPDSMERIDREFGQFQLQRAGEHTQVTVDREQFVDWLLELAAVFRGTPGGQLPLVSLSPVARDDLNGPWQGTWILRLFGATADGPPGEVVVQGRFRADQLPKDLADARGWIHAWEIDQVVIARARQALMQEIGTQSGIDLGRLHDNWQHSRSEFAVTPGGVFACDYNQDGLTDLLITDRGPALLYAGRGGGKFEDVSLEAGLAWEKPQARVAAFADLDNDGDEDLILGTAVLDNRSGQFVRAGHLPITEAIGVSVADYDRDGLVDVYVSRGAPPPQESTGSTSWVDDQSGAPNQLWRNRGNFRFENVTESAGAAAGKRSSFTSLWLDADADDWPDLYVINELGPNVLLHNERNGTFSEHTAGPEVDGFTMGAAAGDLDDDGQIDLYLGNMFSKAGKRIVANVPADAYPPDLLRKMQGWVRGNMLLWNRGALRFEDSQNSLVSGVGWAYGPALVDLDGDGSLDIHSTAGFASFSRSEPDG